MNEQIQSVCGMTMTGETLSPCHFIHHKPHIDWPGVEPWSPWWKTAWAMAWPSCNKMFHLVKNIKCPDQLWGPTTLLFNAYLGSSTQVEWPGNKMTTHLYSVLSS